MSNLTCKDLRALFAKFQKALGAHDKFVSSTEMVDLALNWNAAGPGREESRPKAMFFFG